MRRPTGHLGLRRDGGASTVEYGAVIILVAALLVTVGFVVVPERVRSGTLSAICQLFGGEGCGDVKGAAVAQPKTDPSPGVTYGPPVPVDPNAPVDLATEGLDPNDPDVQRYNNAKTENTNADQAVTGAQAGANEVLKQLKDFLLDVVGWTDLQKCVSSGDVVACISTLINIVPWGKVFKLLKKIPGAIKLAKRLKEIWETLSGAKKRKEAAEKALKEADDIIKKKPKKPVVCKRPSSFLPGTLVLLADGSHRPIEDIWIGDAVWATDPETGVSGPRQVTRLISSQGVKQLVDLTVGNRWLGQHTITATGPHPFWSPDRGAWVEAGELNAIDHLIQPDGRPVQLTSVRHRTLTQRVHNLTVTGLHTYYVLAGSRSVLVHNYDGPASIPQVDNPRLQNIVDALFHGIGNPDLVGDGSAMAAANAEALGADGVEGKDHLRNSTAQLRQALEKFLKEDMYKARGKKAVPVVRSARDILVAKGLIQAIDDARVGKYKGLEHYEGLEC